MVFPPIHLFMGYNQPPPPGLCFMSLVAFCRIMFIGLVSINVMADCHLQQ